MSNRDRAKSQRRRVMAVNYVLRLFLSFAACLNIFVKPTVLGRPDNIPTEGPVIFAFNHLSIFDVIAYFGALKTRKDIAFLATSGLFVWPFGALLRWMGHIPVYRGKEAATQSTSTGMLYLWLKAAVGIFFEGRISKDGKLQYPMNGTAKMAQETGAPVIPVIGAGLDRVKPRGTPFWRWRFGQRYVIIIGEPVHRPDVHDTRGLTADQVEDVEKNWRDNMSANLFGAATELVADAERILAAQDQAVLAA